MDSGRFEEIADVHHAEATIDGYENIEFDTTSSSGKPVWRSPRKAGIAGGVFAGVAALAAGVYVYKSRKNKRRDAATPGVFG